MQKSMMLNKKDKNKMKINYPKTIDEAIYQIQEFFEEDMWSKFHSEIKIPAIRNGKKVILKFYRKDFFKNEDEFIEYINGHFNILRKQIKRLQIRRILK